MALINNTTPFGFRGLQAGQEFLARQNQLDEFVRSSLIRDTEQNLTNQLLGQGFTTPQAATTIGLNSPFLDSGLNRLASGLGASSAIAPFGLAAAQNGDVSTLNSIIAPFTRNGVGNFTTRNFQATSGRNALPLFGAQGAALGFGLRQQDPFNNLLLQSLQLSLGNQQRQAQEANSRDTRASSIFESAPVGTGFTILKQ